MNVATRWAVSSEIHRVGRQPHVTLAVLIGVDLIHDVAGRECSGESIERGLADGDLDHDRFRLP